MALVLISSLHRRAHERHKLRAMEPIGTTPIRIGDRCPILSGYFLDHSLDGLVRRNTPAGPEFTRKEQPVTNFAGQVRVVIYGSIFTCGSSLKETPFQDELMKSLRFRIRWLRGDARYIEAPASVKPQPSTIRPYRYVLLVPSEGVPLATPIDMEISTEYGSEIGVLRKSLADDAPARLLPVTKLQSLEHLPER